MIIKIQHENLQDTANVMLRGNQNFNTYIRKEERININNLSFNVKKLEKEQQIKSKICKREEVVKINYKTTNYTEFINHK